MIKSTIRLDRVIGELAKRAPITAALREDPETRAISATFSESNTVVGTLVFGKPSNHWVKTRSQNAAQVHEPGMLSVLCCLRHMLGADAPLRLFDIGCCHGYLSLFAAEIAGFDDVVAFDMNPRFLLATETNVSLNTSTMERVESVPTGVGARTERNVRCAYKGFALRVAPSDAELEDLKEEGFDVTLLDLTSLENYVANTGHVPDVVKIDVEGSQPSILAGARSVIAQHKPILLIETDLPAAANFEGVSTLELCRTLIADHHYEVAILDHRARDAKAQILRLETLETPLAELAKSALLICIPASRSAA